MDAGQTLVIIITVQSDVSLMLSSELLHHIVNVSHSTGALTHCLSRVVGMAARAIPVLEELRGEGDGNVIVFGNALKDVATHVELVTDGKSEAGTNLVFPLAWHDLSVGSRDRDAGIQTSAVVGVSNSTTEAVVGTNGAVVRALGSGISVVRPAKRPGGELGLSANKRVFLLDTVPRLLVRTSIENFLGVGAEVSVGRHQLGAGGVLPSEGLSHNKHVIGLAEGVTEDSNRFHDDLRIVGGSLIARGTIVVPIRNVLDSVDLALKSTALGAESNA